MISSIKNNTAEKVIIEFLFFTINIIREERDKIHIIIMKTHLLNYQNYQSLFY